MRTPTRNVGFIDQHGFMPDKPITTVGTSTLIRQTAGLAFYESGNQITLTYPSYEGSPRALVTAISTATLFNIHVGGGGGGFTVDYQPGFLVQNQYNKIVCMVTLVSKRARAMRMRVKTCLMTENNATFSLRTGAVTGVWTQEVTGVPSIVHYAGWKLHDQFKVYQFMVHHEPDVDNGRLIMVVPEIEVSAFSGFDETLQNTEVRMMSMTIADMYDSK